MDRASISAVPREVWVVEDNSNYRATLVELLNRSGAYRCRHALSSAERALELLHVEPAPEALFLDLSLPNGDGVTLLGRAKHLAPKLKVLIITQHDDPAHVFSALAAGADGYLTKSSSPQKILDSLVDILAGGAPMSSSIARMVLDRLQPPAVPSAPKSAYGLSDREMGILQHLVAGRTMKEVASALGISYHTVDRHMRGLYGKLHEHTRGGVVAKAMRERLL